MNHRASSVPWGSDHWILGWFFPRSQLPPNKGDRSAAYKLKEKLDMYQAPDGGPKMIQSIFKEYSGFHLYGIWLVVFLTHTHIRTLVMWRSGVCLVYLVHLKRIFSYGLMMTRRYPKHWPPGCSLFGSKPLELGFQGDLMWSNVFPQLSQEHGEQRRW